MCIDIFFRNKINRVVKPETKQNILKDWDNIKILIKSKGPSQIRQALITADKCLDNALRDVVDGETMGERLKNASEIFDKDTYNKIWDAHKVRNTLVHEAGYEPPYFVVTQSIESLKTGLQVLGISL